MRGQRRPLAPVVATGFAVLALLGAALSSCTGRPASTSASVSGNIRAGNGSAFVRVNQLGYPFSSSKRAFLMANVAESGATFALSDGAGQVFAAPVGSDLGSWSPRFTHVYALDFPDVTAPGTYAIAVTGPATAVSAPFRIDTAQNVYAGAIANALGFYRNSRDGVDSSGSPLAVGAGHLHDRDARTYATPRYDGDSGEFQGELPALSARIDASGGWWDAGDYLKFVQTISYTDAVLLSGIRDFPAQMGPGGSSDFTDEARFGTDWLLRMWDDATRTLYYQVGIGEGNDTTAGDHDIWRLPTADDMYGGHDPTCRYIRHRPVFRAAMRRPSPSASRSSARATLHTPTGASRRPSTSSIWPTRSRADTCSP